ncbi:4Fe-4S binding protein [Cryomorpha ignava]|uniref:4Fe-4S binding protein n=1 Tax=Cryomorpha ignava TaxID=101383 RepID=A0A7K3WSL4_9FLAO|nr:4Fe-4S dicluster domain-containing protein [Cryomorpha ignava]NEN24474.1 4Fe-4S binding protein [Cryomorpha ignava]
MKNDTLKKLGLTLFVIAVTVFFSLSFIVDISFKDKDVSSLLEEKNKGLANIVSTIDPAPAYQMPGALRNAFNQYNEVIVNEYGIKDDELKNFIEKLDSDASKFDTSAVQSFFGKDDFLTTKFLENTSWMIGRDWQNFDQFKNSINDKLQNVNKAVVSEYGLGAEKQDAMVLILMTVGAPDFLKTGLWAFLIFGLAVAGGFIHFIPLWRKKPGIHNDHIHHNKSQTRQWPAIIVFVCLVGFYIFLYHYPHYLANQIALLKPLSENMSGGAANQWFLYGFMYTLAMFTMGARMMIKYRGNMYQQVRTVSVFFFQVAFAFTLPQILTRMQLPAYDLKSAWPLEYSFFFDYRIDEYMQNGSLGLFLFGWGVVLFAIGVPLLTYFYGKRWYCSWVCGCGGLAETVGDPYRHLSDKSLGSWKIERWVVHSVLVFAVFMTAWVLYTAISGDSELLGINSYSVRSTYGFFIGFVFAGAVGTGFYPVMGNRVWCRFGCPLAAYLGLVQRFKSRFRITTNGGQCISCGNCSTYCEMGIDVRWYAQRGQNIVRSSCVGCGVCSAVCPRGVLKLENKTEDGRINDNPILIGREGVTLNL